MCIRDSKRSVHLFEYRRRVVVAAVSSWMLQLSQQKHQRHHEASLTLVKSQHTLARAQNLRFCLQSTSRISGALLEWRWRWKSSIQESQLAQSSQKIIRLSAQVELATNCLLYTSPSPRDS
eukprot:TRINITY_DN58468_c0_g1_i1.p1 TRINITY_DN58468_c0_g1~~TRINITY_DN58468_c0_g1_i1.p1  ORF type:complete len:121 (-),score=16.08 TRINITY_DN58468_c0_g1_i1:70-432(-)